MSKQVVKTNWTAKRENKALASLEEAKLIYDQAEKKLKEVIAAGDLVVTRTTTLITVLTAMLFATVSFAITQWTKSPGYDYQIVTAIWLSIYQFSILAYVHQNIRGTKYAVIGASPQTLFKDDFFKCPDAKIREKMFIWAQIENYQDSIELNTDVSKERWQRFNLSLILTVTTPLIMLVFYFLIKTCLF